MRRHTRNHSTTPKTSDLNNPPVPASFAVRKPTQYEFQLREDTADARGIRPIESPWPLQPPRPQPMTGRGSSSRRGRGGHSSAQKANNQAMGYPGLGQDEFLPNQHPGARGQASTAPTTGRGRGVVNTIPQSRTAPLLYSLPTYSERVAAEQAKERERIGLRKARREEERRMASIHRQANAHRQASPTNSNSNSNSSTNSDSGGGGEPVSHTGHTPGSPGAPDSNQSRRAPPSPPPPPPPPPPPGPGMQYVVLNHNDWRSRPEVHVKVGDIPLQYTTLDMYNLFQEYGVVEGIELFENTHGTRDGFGKVKFSHVLEPFWNGHVPYIWHNSPSRLRAQLYDLPRHRFKVTSPVNKLIEYPDRFIFKPKKLEFGFMIEPKVMMAMYTTKDEEDVTFEVNLYRKQVDVIFRIYLTKGDDTSVPGPPTVSPGKEQKTEAGKEDPEAAKDRWESYRFQIPFSELDKILEQGPVISNNNRTFVISLPSPPLYWRELHNVANSHDLNSSYWTSWDKWFRQTGITFDPLERSNSPISLRQRNPIIDTGRWTTYRFQFSLESTQVSRFDTMLSALRDFNVKTEVLDELQVTAEKCTPIWDTIEVRSTNSPSGDLLEALRPLLPYPTRYQLEVCISQNYLNEFNITPEFIDRLTQLGPAEAVRLLEFVAEHKQKRFYNPMDIFSLTGVKKGTAAALLKRAANDCQLVRGASITPSTVYYNTPTVETTNRVIRHYRQYSDRFLRVQFVDEFKGRINSTNKMAMNEVFTRIMTAMDHGITIGGIHFEFLAFGNSQIREHGAYFFASDDHTSVDDIRAWMGEFKDIRVVAKHAARLGQCFSTTRAIRGVQVDVVNIDDIQYPDNEYKFSDGVGKISEFLASLISTELKPPPKEPPQSETPQKKPLKKKPLQNEPPQNEPPPSCFQFRLGGCKGVLTVWPDAKQRDVYIRPTQQKFTATHNILEVIRCSHLATASLNRQLIIVLSSLGALDNVFILKLTDMLKKFEDAMVRPAAAHSLLCTNIDVNQFTLDLSAMVRDKFMDFKEPFVMSLLRLWRAWSIKYLKEKAKIMIEDGAFVLGVVDETGILKGHYDDDGSNGKKKSKHGIPEIFLQISDTKNPGKFRVIEELCIIARNPSLHPGDIRTVRAVNVPELHHLRNVVVFPNNGDRDLASMLSGGDLDGDDYIVIWDRDLTYGITDYKPMDFTPMEPFVLDRDVEVKDITKFFVNYMRNDKLGAIANSHLAWADYLDDGVKSNQCFRLAALHSDAVDYVKTGVPAEMPRELRIKRYPHFMEKEESKSYTSYKILGKLYDLVVKVDFIPAYELQFDERILNAYTLSEDVLTAARRLKGEYDAALHSVMAQHEIHTEFEIYSTFVMHHSKAAKDYKFHEEAGNISNVLKDIWRKAVIQVVGDSDEAKLGPFIAAMYTVTKQELDTALEDLKAKKSRAKKRERYIEGTPLKFTPEDVEGMPLISFPWLFPETLGRLANREYPFTNIDDAPDGILRQYEYDHVAVPVTKRNTRGTRSKSTQDNPECQNTTAADDLAGFEIIPVEEYLGDGSETYINFDYKEQEPDDGMVGMDTNKRGGHAFDSDGTSFSETSTSDCMEFDIEGAENCISKEENHYTPRVSGDGSKASGRSIPEGDGASNFSFCEQLFAEMPPEDEMV